MDFPNNLNVPEFPRPDDPLDLSENDAFLSLEESNVTSRYRQEETGQISGMAIRLHDFEGRRSIIAGQVRRRLADKQNLDDSHSNGVPETIRYYG